MGLEAVTNIADLVRTNPTSADAKSQGDDHLRNIKTALLNDLVGFPGAIMVTGTDGGAVNAYTLTPAYGTFIAYGNRMVAVFSPTITNTGASTLNISGLGAKDVKSVSGAALVANDLLAGSVYAAFYNGTEFRLLSITKNYADQLAFNTALPAQAGNADKLLGTDGATASWTALLKAGTMRWADSVDSSKLLAFDVSAFTTATTRTATWPNKSGTVAMTTDVGQRLLQTITPTVAANIDFLSLFDSTYDDYLIVGDGINHDGTGGTTQNLRIRLSNGGVVDSGSNYFSNGLAVASTTTSATDSQLSANTINSGRGANFEIKVQNVNSSGGLKSAISFSSSQSTATPTLNSASNNLAYVGGVVSGARLFWSVGANFAAQGTIKIYGISKT